MDAVHQFKAVDPAGDSFRIDEHAEQLTAASGKARPDDLSALLGWLIAGGDLDQVGLRALVAASALRPAEFPDGRLHSSLVPHRLKELEHEFAATFAGVSPLAGRGRR